MARDEEDEAMFRVKTGVDARDLNGKLVLDAGCGGGRYALLAARHGAKVVGVDLSSAVEKATALCEGYPDVAIVQADLPGSAGRRGVRPGVLDRRAAPRPRPSAGVPRGCPHGSSRGDGWRSGSTARTRCRRSGRTRPSGASRPAFPPGCWSRSALGLGVLGGVPVLNRTLNKVANFSNHPDWTLRVCDNFDWYAPKYQSHHSVEELKGWFAEEGFDDLVELPPARSGRLYDWAYRNDLVIGSGVNVAGTKISGVDGEVRRFSHSYAWRPKAEAGHGGGRSGRGS